MSQKGYKLIREIKAIIDNPDLHFWIKCKQLVLIETYNRPGSYEGGKLIREFFLVCAGKYKDRFESAYVRPYLNNWEDDHDGYDYVRKIEINDNKEVKIGRNPRGIKIIKSIVSDKRFINYLECKYPEAFEKFEEIKKVNHAYYSETKRTEDCAWQHLFPDVVRHTAFFNDRGKNEWITTKEKQKERRKIDLAMEKAQTDYNGLKKASTLPPRYLYNEVSLAELQNKHKNHTYAIFGKYYYITIDTTLHYDDSNVHHGLGKLTHTDRVLRIRDKDGQRLYKVLKTYSGNFVLNAIEKHFRRKIKKVKVADELKPVQLNPKMEVIEARTPHMPRDFRLFKRLFAGVAYDYCVLKDGITYHGPSPERCLSGWKKKKTLSKAGAKIINMKACMALGFCSTGVRSFCSSNSIDSHESYTVEELKKIVKKNLSYNRMYFGHELKQIGFL